MFSGTFGRTFSRTPLPFLLALTLRIRLRAASRSARRWSRLTETANSNFKDHHGRFAKGSIKVLGRNKIALALAFFVDAVNTRLIIRMPTEFFERWTGSADPYLPDPEDPTWADPDHEPPATRAGPEGRAVTTSPATLESIIT